MQISSLKQENKILVKKRVKKTEGDPTVKGSHGDKVNTTENKDFLSTNIQVPFLLSRLLSLLSKKKW